MSVVSTVSKTVKARAAAKAAIMATHRAFLRLPVGTIKRHANNEEIAIAIENLERVGS